MTLPSTPPGSRPRSSSLYWSSSPSADKVDGAWYLSFYAGYSGYGGGCGKDCGGQVQLVRGPLWFLVMATAGVGGTVGPGGQMVDQGATTQVTVTPNTGYVPNASVGGTCPAGSWSGTTYTTGVITAECSVSFHFSLDPAKFCWGCLPSRGGWRAILN